MIAKAGEKVLYMSDLDFLFTEKKAPADSAEIAKNYAEAWVKKQIFLQAAEIKFKDADEEINRKIEDYRAQLLIHAFRKQHIEENIDTLITEEQIRSYYEQNKENFRLSNDLTDVIWAKISIKEDIDTDDLKEMLKKPTEENLQKAHDFCTKYCVGFSLKKSNWLPFSDLANMEAFSFKNPQNLPVEKIIEGKDNSYSYFWRVNSLVRAGEIAPADYVRVQIIDIIINKRKNDLDKQLENDLFKQAQEQKNYEVYH
jgi:hypothetical protein